MTRSILTKFLALLMAIGLFGAACSSDDDGVVAGSGDDTEQPSDGDGNGDSGTDDGTDDGDDDGAAVDASTYAGAYAGTWTNTTFGSEGTLDGSLAVDGDTYTIELDLGGFVFGASDPDPETLTGTVPSGGSATVTSATFGEVTITFDAATGEFTVTADAVPNDGIESMTASGTVDASGTINGTYTVTFPGGDGAEGTFTLTRA